MQIKEIIRLLLWQPHYTMTSPIVRGLMDIEAVRAVIAQTPLSPIVDTELRKQARLRSTHYSTQIEGNRLTLAEPEEVIAHSRTRVSTLSAKYRQYIGMLSAMPGQAEKTDLNP